MGYRAGAVGDRNAGGRTIDGISGAKIALGRGIGGPITSASAYFMKAPPEQYSDSDAYAAVEAFIRGEVDR